MSCRSLDPTVIKTCGNQTCRVFLIMEGNPTNYLPRDAFQANKKCVFSFDFVQGPRSLVLCSLSLAVPQTFYQFVPIVEVLQ